MTTEHQISSFTAHRGLSFAVGRNLFATAALVTLLAAPGCNGRSIKEDNPVFAPPPPRRTLVNESADAEELRLAGLLQSGDGPLQTVGTSQLGSGPLAGNTIVALVNGRPVFLDDVMRDYRMVIENNPDIPEQHRQRILETELRKRLPKYVDDELVMQAAQLKIPKEKQTEVRQTLEPRFQEVVEKIRQRENKSSQQELDQWLGSQGSSIEDLRNSFFRIQLVEGYITSNAQVPEKVSREELLRYYEDHRGDYTPQEQIRVSKIVVRFQKHGGEEPARQRMDEVLNGLAAGREFGDLATEYSDALNAEKRGDMGWIGRGSLAADLEELLFSLQPGTASPVKSFDDRLELYFLADYNNPQTIPFSDVQKEIQEQLLEQKRQQAREAVREQLRVAGTVVMAGQASAPKSSGPF
ncbi:MAG: peptidylprolyl isomerase [Planctomycetota bacterium]